MSHFVLYTLTRNWSEWNPISFFISHFKNQVTNLALFTVTVQKIQCLSCSSTAILAILLWKVSIDTLILEKILIIVQIRFFTLIFSSSVTNLIHCGSHTA